MIVIYQKMLADGNWETISAPLEFEPNEISKLIPYLKSFHGENLIRIIDEASNVILSENQIH